MTVCLLNGEKLRPSFLNLVLSGTLSQQQESNLTQCPVGLKKDEAKAKPLNLPCNTQFCKGYTLPC